MNSSDDYLWGNHVYAISALKSFNMHASDARRSLDSGYAKIGTRDPESFNDVDWCAVGMDILPRPALFAIASNHHGMFSEYEMAAAKRLMERRLQRAMQAANPFGLEHRRGAMLKAAVKYLGAGCPEEKASQEWITAIAAARAGYGEYMRARGRPAEISFENDLAA